jgi:acyl dehydratase
MALRHSEVSRDHSSAHLDEDLARFVGLPGVVLHGLYSMALVARTANETVGGDPRSLLSLTVQMREVAVPGKEIEVTGTVSGSRAGAGRTGSVAGR